MLTKWFRTRSPRSPELSRFFRPELEALENRLVPSNVLPMHGPGDGNGNGNGHGHGHGGGGGGDGPPAPPPIAGPVVNQGGAVNVAGNHNNIHITNSFNGSSFLPPLQAGEVGLMFALSSLIAAETGSSQLGGLLNDEVALAVDKYLVGQLANFSGTGITSLLNSVNSDIGTLTSAIHTNPLGSTLLGQVIGTMVQDFTLDALTSAQPKL